MIFLSTKISKRCFLLLEKARTSFNKKTSKSHPKSIQKSSKILQKLAQWAIENMSVFLFTFCIDFDGFLPPQKGPTNGQRTAFGPSMLHFVATWRPQGPKDPPGIPKTSIFDAFLIGFWLIFWCFFFNFLVSLKLVLGIIFLPIKHPTHQSTFRVGWGSVPRHGPPHNKARWWVCVSTG